MTQEQEKIPVEKAQAAVDETVIKAEEEKGELVATIRLRWMWITAIALIIGVLLGLLFGHAVFH